MILLIYTLSLSKIKRDVIYRCYIWKKLCKAIFYNIIQNLQSMYIMRKLFSRVINIL